MNKLSKKRQQEIRDICLALMEEFCASPHKETAQEETEEQLGLTRRAIYESLAHYEGKRNTVNLQEEIKAAVVFCCKTLLNIYEERKKVTNVEVEKIIEGIIRDNSSKNDKSRN